MDNSIPPTVHIEYIKPISYIIFKFVTIKINTVTNKTFIDDSPKNIEEAIKLGINGIIHNDIDSTKIALEQML